MNFPRVARIITRGDANGHVDLLLGAAFKDQQVFKPNRVYELVEVFGEIIIRDIGTCIIENDASWSAVANWGQGVNRLLDEQGTALYLTQEEYEQQYHSYYVVHR
jgi:hypothetical protein